GSGLKRAAPYGDGGRGRVHNQVVEKAGDAGNRRWELSIQGSRVQVPSSPPYFLDGSRLEAEALGLRVPPLLDSTGELLQSVVDVFPPPDTADQPYQVLTLDQVDDPIIANSQPEELLGTLQLLSNGRSWVVP